MRRRRIAAVVWIALSLAEIGSSSANEYAGPACGPALQTPGAIWLEKLM